MNRWKMLLRGRETARRSHVWRKPSPDCPEHWGWRPKRPGRAWVPQGARIGWLAASDLFLKPTASYQVAQQMAGTERLPVSAQTLRQSVARTRPVGQRGRRPPDAAGAPDCGRRSQASTSPEGSRIRALETIKLSELSASLAGNRVSGLRQPDLGSHVGAIT
jgi:hypothetical protein